MEIELPTNNLITEPTVHQGPSGEPSQAQDNLVQIKGVADETRVSPTENVTSDVDERSQNDIRQLGSLLDKFKAKRVNAEAVLSSLHTCISNLRDRPSGINRQELLDDIQDRIAVERLFIRRHGVIYVPDEHWGAHKDYSPNAHLYVSSTITKVSTPESQSTIGKAQEKEVSLERERAATPISEETSETPSARALPRRLKILSFRLGKEIARICWDPPIFYHIFPFRCLIPFEKAFREKHQELEAQFAKLSKEFPDHPAVLREFEEVPYEWKQCDEPLYTFEAIRPYLRDTGFPEADKIASDCSVIFPKLKPDDEIEKKRILLDGFRSLIHVLDTDLSPLVKCYRGIQSMAVDKLPFSHLWYLFAPGQEIITKNPKDQAYRVLQVTGGRQALEVTQDSRGSVLKDTTDLVIDCFYADYDGENFGPVATRIFIKPYDGLRSITDLPTYPLHYKRPGADGLPTTAQNLADRGRKYEELTRIYHMRYKGLTLLQEGYFETIDEVDSDVIVDAEVVYRKIPKLKPLFQRGAIATPTTENEEENRVRDTAYYDESRFLKKMWLDWSNYTNLLRTFPPGHVPQEIYVLLTYRVYAYVLLSRQWYPLDIDSIRPVPRVKPGENDGFEKLILPRGHKEIIRALISTHARKANMDGPRSEFDVIKGKGKGLIILLHGAPGVGKTSTAESVAANAGKPLFPITCGDIGAETAQEVEENLEGYFSLARKWQCVLLLDEADVFLGSRAEGDLRRNSLVSVFLRVLEYYPGILILTTNRVGSFDEAIKSRIHCSLYYPKLDREQTFKVWEMNIKILEEKNIGLPQERQIQFDSQKIRSYARRHWREGNRMNRWNGRQIKNAFQTAVALADWDTCQASDAENPTGPVLKTTHFRKVAKASRHFDRYLARTRQDDETRARDAQMREDRYDLEALSSSSADMDSDDSSDSDDSWGKKASSRKKHGRRARTSKGKNRKQAPKISSKSKRSRYESSPSEYSESQTESASDDESGSESSASQRSNENNKKQQEKSKRRHGKKK